MMKAIIMVILMIIAFAVANVSAQVYPSGMVSYWKGEGNAEDSYNSNDGILMDGVTFDTGIVGQAFSFDGVDDYVKIGNLGSFPDQGTIIFWMYPHDLNYTNPFGTDVAGDNAGIRFEADPYGKFEAAIAGVGYNTYLFTYSGISVENWYLVTLTWDKANNNTKGYLNGALVFDRFTSSWPSGLPDVEIGKGIGYYSDRNWKGLIDEVAIFSRVLTADEIQQHYQNGLQGLGYEIVVAPIPIPIDIKPGSFPNSINLKSKGNVPVAILSNSTFDATTIDRVTVEFAGASPLPLGQTPQDVNSDGLMDVVLHFKTQDLKLDLGDTEACMTGKTLSGQEFEGCDSVRIVK